MAMSERDRLLKQIPESGDASSVAPNSSDNQDKLQQADQRYKQLLDDTVAYRKEMEAELQEQREELQHIRAEASTLRQEYNGALLEIDQHKQRNIGLSHVSASRQNEIDDLRRRAIARESHVEKLEAHILSLNNELLNLSRDMEALRNDHSSVQSQLAASNTSYQRLLDTNKDLATERGNLKTLLQDMNERLASSTTGTTHLVEELKQHNERLSRELQNLRDTLTAKEKELRGHQAIDQSEWKDKYQTSVGELKQLKATVLDLEQKLATANQDRMVAQAKLNEALKNSTTVASTTSDTVDDVGVDSSNDPLVEQVKLLADANNQIISLKKELFDVKGRLADADATANKITEAYNTFTSESQVRIDKLSDDLATSNEKVDTMQTDMEKVLTEQKEAKAAHATLELQWESTKAALTEENQQLQSKTTALSTQITNVQAELDAKIEQLQQSEDRYQIQVADRAKDADTIGNLRDEIRQLNADIMTSKTEVLSAQERLRSAELSYRNQREQLETEQNDMKLR
jgi:chromosome segregation ATPase